MHVQGGRIVLHPVQLPSGIVLRALLVGIALNQVMSLQREIVVVVHTALAESSDLAS